MRPSSCVLSRNDPVRPSLCFSPGTGCLSMFGSSSSSSSLSSSSSSPLSGLFPASNSNPPPPARSSWLHDPYVSIPITCSAVLGASLFWRRYFRRIPSAAYVTPRTLSSRKSIRGYVTAIGDADGFRLYHTPGVWLFARLWRVPKDKKVLKDKTISIRIAGVDAPEVLIASNLSFVFNP